MNTVASGSAAISIRPEPLQFHPLWESSIASTLVIIDAGVEDSQALVDGVVEGAAVAVLDRDRDGIRQITEILSQHPQLTSLHVVSHGSPGCLYLGNTRLSLDTLQIYAKELQSWFGVAEAQLLLYGCNVAVGDAGAEFVEKLQAITGASVAASSSLTGNAARGGNWELDHRIGDISADFVFTQQALETYSGVLGVVDVAGQILKFTNASQTLVSGTANAVGATYKYTNVATIGGVQIDALVQIVGATNATVISTDVSAANAGAAYIVAASPSGTQTIQETDLFAPQVATTAANGHVDFKISFQDVGGNPLILDNFYSNSIDIDGTEFVDYGKFTSYETQNPGTQVAIAAGSGSEINFRNSTAGTVPGLSSTDPVRAQVKFNAVSSLDFSVGATTAVAAPGRLFGSIFALIPFTPGSTVVAAPTVNTLLTHDSTPSITGTVGNTALGGAETFSVTVNGVTYNKGNVNLIIAGTNWTLNVPTVLAQNTYDVSVTRGGFLDDQTTQELTVVNSRPVIDLNSDATSIGEVTNPPVPTGNKLTTPPQSEWEVLFYAGHFGVAGSSDPTSTAGAGGAGTPTLHAEGFLGQGLNTFTFNTGFLTGAQDPVASTAAASGITFVNNSTNGAYSPAFYGNSGIWSYVLRRTIAEPTTITIGKAGDAFDDYGEIFVNGTRINPAILAFTYSLGAGQVMTATVNPGDVVEIRLTNRLSTGAFVAQFSSPGLIPDANFTNTFVENKPPVSIVDTDGDIADSGENDITKLSIAVANLKDGAAEKLVITDSASTTRTIDLSAALAVPQTVLFGATTFSIAYNGTTFTVTNNAGAATPMAQADLDAFIRALKYQNTSATPTVGGRTLTFTLTDSTNQVSQSPVSTINLRLAPKITISPIATDDIVNDLEDNSPVAIAGTTANVEDGRVVTVTLNGKTYTATVASNAWTLNIPAADAQALAATGTATADVSNLAGDTATQATRTVAHDTLATIAINPIAIDDNINATEAASPVAISGTTTGVENGQTVTVLLNSKTYTTTVTGNAWTVSVPVADVAALKHNELVTANVSDLAGNAATQANRGITVNNLKPSIDLNSDATSIGEVTNPPVPTGNKLTAPPQSEWEVLVYAGMFGTAGASGGNDLPQDGFGNDNGTPTLHAQGFLGQGLNSFNFTTNAGAGAGINSNQDPVARAAAANGITFANNPTNGAYNPAFYGNSGFWSYVLRRQISDPTTITLGKPGDTFDDFGEIYVNGVRVNPAITSYTPSLAASQVMTATVNPGDIVEIRLSNIGGVGGFTVGFSSPGLIPDANFTNTFVEGKPPINVVDTDGDIADSGENDITKLSIAVANLKDGAAEKLVITDSASTTRTIDLSAALAVPQTVVFGATTFSIAYDGTTFTVTNNAGASTPMAQADLDAFIRALKYQNTSATPTVGGRTLTFTLTDNTNRVSLSPVSTINLRLAPKITISPIATDDIVNDLEDNSPVAIAGTTANVEDGRTVTVTLNGKTYTATVASNAWTLNIPAADAQALTATGTATADVSNLAGDTATQATRPVAHDAIAPTIAITSSKPSLKVGDTATLTFTLSEAVTDFDVTDITVSGGTLSGFTGSGTSYTALFTPAANSNVNGVINVASGKFTDAAGNPNADGADANNTVTMAVDTIAPTIAITSSKASLKAGDTATLTFTLSEAVTDFDATDITVLGGTLSGFTGSGTSYTALFTPTANSTTNGVINVASGKFTDAAGNQNADGADADNTVTMAVDTIAPTIAITSSKPSLKAGDTATLTFTLSEAVTDFDATDITVSGGTLSGFTGSGTSYTATFTPTANSTTNGVINVASGKFTDAAGNQNADGADANNTVTMAVDTIVPTIAITSSKAALKIGDTATLTFTISEAVTDFDATDITVSGGTLSGFTGSGTTYTATFTPTANSTTNGVINVASSKFSDAAGNQNADGADADNTVTMAIDTIAPTIAISPIATDDIINDLEDNSPVAIAGTTTGVEDGRIVTVTLNSKTYTATVASNAWTLNVPAADAQALAASSTVTADVSDLAGNPATQVTRSIAHDAVAPTVTVAFSDGGDGRLSGAEDNTVVFSGTTTAEAGQTVSLSISDGTNPAIITTAIVQANGTYTTTGTDLSGLNNGTLTVTATVADIAGNPATPATATTILDNVAPTVTVTFGDGGDGRLSGAEDNTVILSGTTTAEAGQTVSLSISDGTNPAIITTAIVQANGTYTTTGTDLSTLNNGTLTVTATVADIAGNPATPATATTILDNVAPTVTVTFGDGGDGRLSGAEDNTVILSGTTTAEAGQTVSLSISDGTNPAVTTTAIVQANGTYTTTGTDLSTLNNGTLTVTATVSDLAGNPATPATATTILDNVAPTVTVVFNDGGDGRLSGAEDNTVVLSGTTTAEAGQTVSLSISDGTNPAVTTTAIVQANGTYATTGTDLSTLNNGTLTVTATVADLAGNPATPATATTILDNVAPTVTVTFGDGGDGRLSGAEDNTVILSGTTTAEAGQTVSLSISDGTSPAIITTAIVQANGTYTTTGTDLSTLNNGTLTVTATVADLAGNPATPATATTILDNVAPTVTVAFSDGGDGRLSGAEDNTVVFSGTTTAEAGQTVSLSISDGTNPAVTTTAIVQANGTYTTTGTDLSGLNNGTLTVTATVSDLAGNPATPATATTILDNVAPTVTVVFNDGGDGRLSGAEDNTVVFSGTTTAEAGQTVSLSISDGTNPAIITTAIVQANGTYTTTGTDLSTLNNGTLTVTATVADLAGNPATPATATTILDNVAPTVTVVFNDGGDGRLSGAEDNTVILSGTTSAEAGQTVSLSISDGTNPAVTTTAIVQANGTYTTTGTDLSTLNNGTLTVTASVSDLAGNPATPATATTILDNVAPTVTVVFNDGGDGRLSGAEDNTVILSGTTSAEAGQTVSLSISDGTNPAVTTTAIVQANGTYTTTGTDLSTLNNGTLTVTATVSDLAGNPATPATATTILDNVAPTVTVAFSDGGDGRLSGAEDNTVVFSGTTTAEAGQTVSLSISDGTSPAIITTAIVQANGTYTTTGTDLSTLNNGTLTVTATVADIAGNPATPATAKTILDNVAPTVTVTFGDGGDGRLSGAEDNTVILSGTTTAEAGQTVSLSISDGTNPAVTTTAIVQANGTYTTTGTDLSALKNGTLTVTATVADIAGNPATPATATTILDNVAPTVTVTFGDGGDGRLSGAEDNTVILSGTTSAEAGQTVSLSISDGTNPAVTTTAIVQANGTYTTTGTDLSTLNNGTLTVTATVADLAGNPATPATATTILDNVAPTVTVTFSDGGDGRLSGAEDNTVILSGTTTAEAGQTVSLSISDGTNPAIITTAIVQVNGTYTTTGTDLSTLNNGTLTVTATVSDVAGNPATPVTATTILDNVAPTVTVTFGDGGDGRLSGAEDNTVILSGTTTAEAGQTVSLSISDGTNPAIITTAIVQVNGTYTTTGTDLSTLNNGTLTVTATVSDVAGNPATPVTATTILDNVAPTVTVTFGDGGDGRLSGAEDNTVILSGTTSAEAGQTVSLSISDGTSPAVTTTAIVQANGTYATTGTDLSTLNNGTLTVTATVADLAGNPATPATATTILDNVAPTVTVTFGDGGDGRLSGAEDNTVILSGTTTAEAGQTVSLSISDGTSPAIITTAIVQANGTYTTTGTDLSTLNNGTLTVTATVADLAGNPATPATATTILDNVAPTVTVAFSDGGDGRLSGAEDNTVVFSGTTTAEAGQTVSLSISDGTNPAVTTTAIVQANGTYTTTGTDLSGLNNGTLTVTATVSDLAGNPATPATATTILDNVAPTVTVVFNDGGDGRLSGAEDNTVVFSGTTTAEAGQTVSLSISDGTNPAIITTAIVQANGTYTTTGTDLSTLNNGTLTVTATVADLAGNPATPATATTILDNVAPTVTVVFNDGGDGRLSGAEDNTVILSGTTSAEAGQTVSLSISDGTNPAVTTTAIVQANGTYTTTGTDLSTLNNGTLTVTASVSDLAGNPATPATATTILDNVAPTVTVVFNDGGDGRLSGAEDNTVILSGTTSAEAGQTVSLSISDGTNPAVTTTAIVQANGTYTTTGTDLSTLNNGTLTVTATVSDLAGNPATPATATTILDNVAPTVTVAFSDGGDGRLSGAEDNTVVFSGTTTAEAGQTVSLSISDGTSPAIITTAIVQANGTYTTTGTDLSTLNNGTLTVTATVSDLAGNPATPATATTILDNVAPTVTVAFSDGGDGRLSGAEDNTVVLSGTTTAEAGQTVSLSISDGTNPAVTTTAIVQANGTYTTTGTDLSTLNNGTLTVTATVSDVAGNPATPVTATTILDNVAPTVTVTFGDGGDGRLSGAEDNTVILSGTTTAEAGQTVSLSISDGTNPAVTTTAIVQANGTYTTTGTDLSTLNNGTLTVTATVADLAGNPATPATATTILDNVAPTVTVTFGDGGDGRLSGAEDNTVILSGTTTAEAGQTVSLSISDGTSPAVTTTAIVQANGTYTTTGTDLSTLNNGTLTVTATVSDLAGNPATPATATTILDNVAPTVTVAFSDGGDGRLSGAEDNTVVFSGTTTAEAGQTVSLSISDGTSPAVTTTAIVQANGTYATTGTDLSTLNNGTLTVTATVADIAGNPATPATATTILDNVAPTVTVTFGDGGDGRLSGAEDNTVILSGTTTAEAGQTVSLSISDGTNPAIITTAIVQANGTYTTTGTDLSTLNNGTLTVTATVADIAGNPATPATATTILDNVAPTVTVTFGDGGDGRLSGAEDNTVILSGTTTAEAGQTVSLSISDGTNPAVTTTAIVQANGTYTTTGTDLSALKNGTLTVTATVSDVAGNPATPATATTILDNAAPTIAISPIATDDIINDLEDNSPVAIAGTTTGVEDGQTLTVKLHGITYTTTVTNNAWTVNVPAAAAQALNASEIVTVDVSDLAGNPAVQATRTITHDPTAPVVTVNPLTTNDGTPQLTGTIDDSTATIQVTVNGQTYAATNNGNGTWTLADNTITTALTSGTYDIAVSATDTAGNVGTDTTTNELTVDTTVPVVTVNALTTKDGTPQLTGTVDDAAATIQVTVNGQTYAATNNGNGTWTLADNTILTPLPDGTYNVTVAATDSLGNVGTDTTNNELTIDTTAPVVTVKTVSTNDSTPRLVGTVDDPTAVVKVTVNGQTYTATNNGNGTWTLPDNTIATPLPDGTYDVAVVATDPLGNAGNDSTTNELVINSKAPSVTVDVLAINDATPKLTGTVSDPTAVVKITVNGQTYTATNNGDGTWTLPDNTISTPIPDGTYDIAATATDPLGNTGTDSTIQELTIDATPPVITVNPLTTADNTPQLTGTVDDPTAVVQVTVDGQTYAAINNGDGTWVLPDDVIPAPLPDGTYDVKALATDAFGNIGTDSTTQELNVSAQPPVISIDLLTTSDTTPALTGKINNSTATIQITVNGQTYTAINNGDGTWALPDNTISTPLPTGTYNITATATNTLGSVGTDTTNNELTISPPNQPPIAQDANNSVIPGATVQVAGLSATDVDGSIASYTIVTLPNAAQGSLFLGNPAANGSPVQAGQVLTPTQISQLYFRASQSFTAASLTYTATDDKGAIDPTPATANFKFGNLPPVAADFTPAAPIKPGETVPITGLAASDPDGVIVSYTITSLPEATQGILYLGDPVKGGSPVLNGQVIQPKDIGNLFFKALAQFTGTQFTYTTTDNTGAIDANGATVTLGVSRVLTEYCPNLPGVVKSGGRRKNTLIGTDNRDRLVGKGGNDTLRGGASADILLGGRGNDRLFGGSCNDVLSGGPGKDRLRGGTGNDRLRGDRGNDRLWGNSGNDRLWGGQGNDGLSGGSGNDRLSGGLGKDRLFGNSGNDTLSGGRGNDRLNGGTGNDKLKGNLGNDILKGGRGQDTLQGGLGQDTLKGGAGNDRLSGGRGNDWLGGNNGNDILKGGAGNDTLWGGRGRDMLLGGIGNDRLIGRQGNDKLNGGRGDDVLKGGAGRDRLQGKQGNDILLGGNQADTLVGGFGDDQLYGNRGSDILKGGFGHDLMSGGQGKDRFVYSNAREGGDRITDFKVNQDAIDLSRIFAQKEYVSSKPFRDYVKLVQVGSSTVVQIDTNGKAAGGFETLATLDNVAANRLNANSFIL